MRTSLIALIVGLCALAASAEAPEGEFDGLMEGMTGSFSSRQQAVEDEEYFDIRLEMVRIWPQRTDGRWLYVEQAAASALGQPYRQRIYRVTSAADGAYESVVFELPDATAFIGSWGRPELFDSLEPEQLALRDGCSVFLHLEGEGVFRGSTNDTLCSSSLRGASYATSEVAVFSDRMESWDRGFSPDGSQVWGAEKGPYVFRRASGSATR